MLRIECQRDQGDVSRLKPSLPTISRDRRKSLDIQHNGSSMDVSPPIQSGSNGPLAKECHRFLVAGPFKLSAVSYQPVRDGDQGFPVCDGCRCLIQCECTSLQSLTATYSFGDLGARDLSRRNPVLAVHSSRPDRRRFREDHSSADLPLRSDDRMESML